MISFRLLLLATLFVPVGCTIVDIHPEEGRAEIQSDGLIDGFASAGWEHDPSFLRVEVLDGRSDGSVALVDLGYLARVEVGLVGASVGLGPFDVGIGTLFYEPVSPSRPWTWDGRRNSIRIHGGAPSHDPDCDTSDCAECQANAECEG